MAAFDIGAYEGGKQAFADFYMHLHCDVLLLFLLQVFEHYFLLVFYLLLQLFVIPLAFQAPELIVRKFPNIQAILIGLDFLDKAFFVVVLLAETAHQNIG